MPTYTLTFDVTAAEETAFQAYLNAKVQDHLQAVCTQRLNDLRQSLAGNDEHQFLADYRQATPEERELTRKQWAEGRERRRPRG